MNPDTNRFEPLTEVTAHLGTVSLLRPDGSPVPAHWCVFAVGELVSIRNCTFRVAYVGEAAILFEPAGIPIIGGPSDPHAGCDPHRPCSTGCSAGVR